jgi:hypothetical protein
MAERRICCLLLDTMEWTKVQRVEILYINSLQAQNYRTIVAGDKGKYYCLQIYEVLGGRRLIY